VLGESSRGVRAARVYAGIGSREAPAPVLDLIRLLASRLARSGWVVRTGLSPGADQAFYHGALDGGGGVELYLPWPGFQAGARVESDGEPVTELSQPSQAAYQLAARIYRAWGGPAWRELGAGQRALLARDAHQVLGPELDDPVAHVVCWTADAGLDGGDPRSGGTGQALRIAHEHSIEVFNLARPEHVQRVRELELVL
jgi:hypothetical protein